MRSISIWAKSNPAKARWLTAAIKLLLAFSAVYTGLLFAGLGINFTNSLLYISALVTFILILLYPKKKNKRRPFSYSYARQKACDFLISVCSFISIMVMTNQLSQPVSHLSEVMASAVHIKPTAAQILESLKFRDKKTLTNQEKKILRKEFFKQVKIYMTSTIKDDKTARKNSGLIILTILGALSLTFILAAVVCSLTCNGSDVAAVVVGIVGMAALIWGSIAIINSIIRGPKKEKASNTSP